jgi:hypothetical protein
MRILVHQGAVARMVSGRAQLPGPPSRAGGHHFGRATNLQAVWHSTFAAMYSSKTPLLIRVLAAALVVSASAVPALAQGKDSTSPRPNFGSCDPGRELAQSAAP